MSHMSLFDSNKATMILLPLNRDDAVYHSEGVDMRSFDYVDFLLQVGNIDTTLDAEVEESDNADMSIPSDVAGSDITQITGLGDNRMVIISVSKEALTKPYVGLKITIGNGIVGAYCGVVAVQHGKTGRLPVTQHPSGGEAYQTAEVVYVD